MSRSVVIRTVVLGILAGLLVWQADEKGVPRDRERVLLWAGAFLLTITVGDGTHRARRYVIDWLPVAIALAVYDLTRGAADTLGMPIHTQLPIVADKIMFLGTVPSVELQDALEPFRGERWWEAGMALTYFSHFVFPLIALAGFWVASRSAWARYLRRFMILTVAGLATYILVPTRPPWMASEMGEIGEIDRVATRGFRLINFHRAADLVDKGRASVNPVAALPSLHGGYSMLVAVALWPFSPRWLRPLLAAYPIAMAFTLVVGGEHYFFDALLGWIYVAGACWAARRWEARDRSLAPPDPDAMERLPTPPPVPSPA